MLSMKIVLKLNRQDRCFSKATVTTDLNSLSLLLQHALDGVENDLAKATTDTQRSWLEKEKSDLTYLINELDDEDVFADGNRRVIESEDASPK